MGFVNGKMNKLCWRWLVSLQSEYNEIASSNQPQKENLQAKLYIGSSNATSPSGHPVLIVSQSTLPHQTRNLYLVDCKPLSRFQVL
jgi:hypothetical protein